MQISMPRSEPVLNSRGGLTARNGCAQVALKNSMSLADSCRKLLLDHETKNRGESIWS